MSNDPRIPGVLQELDGLKPVSSAPLLGSKVMMIDDEPLMTDLIQTHLEEEGYQNFVAINDPRGAIAQIRAERPAVILLDLMMPQLSGFELLEAMRADQELRYTPVIVLTAAANADSKLRALRLGATDFLAKPVDGSELVLRVRNTLAFHEYHNRLANFDPVTDLPNQRPFNRGIEEMVARRNHTGGMVALLNIVIPEWQHLREGIGQKSADALIKVLARRLEKFAADGSVCSTASAERGAYLARIAAEHFGLLIDSADSAPGVEEIALRLVTELSRPISIGPHAICANVWIGIALAPNDGTTAEALRKSADLATSQARLRGGSRIEFASPELNAASYRKMTLGLQLRGAADRGELVLHYQPKVCLRQNRIVGVEALVRWNHPELGLMPPGQFIGLAEELGLIGGIGQWVLDRACRDAAAWNRTATRALTVAVNVSKLQFQSGNLPAVVRDTLLKHGLPPSLLVIELTESIFMDDASGGIGLMRELKALGVKLSIDDFGTGYSSLSYLKKLPVDELKIDRSFITDLATGEADQAIVRAVIDLGHSLGIDITAEGVEGPIQRQILQELRCDKYQGFLFSRPLPWLQITALLGENQFRTPTV
jgi:EAL domain-containing protein (putative c-di-GMP-specific phosphodiesterase class I)/PleD family two-component response regulator